MSRLDQIFDPDWLRASEPPRFTPEEIVDISRVWP
jgi:hypothetical protein